MRDLNSPTRDGPHPPAALRVLTTGWPGKSQTGLFFLNYLFIFGGTGSSLPCWSFRLLWRARAALLRGTGFSCGAQGLGARSSVVTAHGLSSCGAWAELLWYMWNLLGPRIEPMFPTLAGRLLATAPPGKFPRLVLKVTVELGSHGWRQGMWENHNACCSHGDLAIFLELMPFRLLQNFG